eukprot:TRINITY_DN5743_c0_g1_i1.p1 TRINITY_DN5743_c0_g1~~TRINITY_DN5743_c0_g1_i1.p1  ORF type:complete len:251 (-),score=60.22 TRINITY_DN5743_c0_g1_i1:132-821(-)
MSSLVKKMEKNQEINQHMTASDQASQQEIFRLTRDLESQARLAESLQYRYDSFIDQEFVAGGGAAAVPDRDAVVQLPPTSQSALLSSAPTPVSISGIPVAKTPYTPSTSAVHLPSEPPPTNRPTPTLSVFEAAAAERRISPEPASPILAAVAPPTIVDWAEFYPTCIHEKMLRPNATIFVQELWALYHKEAWGDHWRQELVAALEASCPQESDFLPGLASPASSRSIFT